MAVPYQGVQHIKHSPEAQQQHIKSGHEVGVAHPHATCATQWLRPVCSSNSEGRRVTQSHTFLILSAQRPSCSPPLTCCPAACSCTPHPAGEPAAHRRTTPVMSTLGQYSGTPGPMLQEQVAQVSCHVNLNICSCSWPVGKEVALSCRPTLAPGDKSPAQSTGVPPHLCQPLLVVACKGVVQTPPAGNTQSLPSNFTNFENLA